MYFTKPNLPAVWQITVQKNTKVYVRRNGRRGTETTTKRSDTKNTRKKLNYPRKYGELKEKVEHSKSNGRRSATTLHTHRK